MLRVFFGTLVALTLWSAAPARSAETAPDVRKSPAARTTPVPTVADLYSLRARRRMASYLRLRLLEWREAGLQRAADVVERRLPVDALMPGPIPSEVPTKH